MRNWHQQRCAQVERLAAERRERPAHGSLRTCMHMRAGRAPHRDNNAVPECRHGIPPPAGPYVDWKSIHRPVWMGSRSQRSTPSRGSPDGD